MFLKNNKSTEIFFHFTMLSVGEVPSEVLFGKSYISRERGTAMTSKRLTH